MMIVSHILWKSWERIKFEKKCCDMRSDVLYMNLFIFLPRLHEIIYKYNNPLRSHHITVITISGFCGLLFSYVKENRKKNKNGCHLLFKSLT